ncbi:MAG TPA: alpha/beta hydrolase [Microthrixaceae bacterium]|nr:alpha/beta hydrolase [Microthrixaceae bacterium]
MGNEISIESMHVPDGARRPDRRRVVSATGVEISVAEWGDENDPAIFMAHGGFDFAETFNRFAPMLADAGYRVVTWDQRGHGDSQWAHLYNWEADERDGAAVLATLPEGPIPFLGHSKGGSLMMALAEVAPHRVSALVNLDGLPSGNNMPDVSERERTRMQGEEMEAWLEHRRSLIGKQRRPGTLAELAERRGRMNPRMSREWLEYLVTVGGRQDEDGWRWKLDPTMRMGGFGPWRPEWAMLRLPGLGAPVLGVLGAEFETMGWGTTAADVKQYLPPGARLVSLEDVGHFVHIEKPRLVADLVLEFLS